MALSATLICSYYPRAARIVQWQVAGVVDVLIKTQECNIRFAWTDTERPEGKQNIDYAGAHLCPKNIPGKRMQQAITQFLSGAATADEIRFSARPQRGLGPHQAHLLLKIRAATAVVELQHGWRRAPKLERQDL